MRIVRYYNQKSEEPESGICEVLHRSCGALLGSLTGLKAQETNSVEEMLKCLNTDKTLK